MEIAEAIIALQAGIALIRTLRAENRAPTAEEEATLNAQLETLSEGVRGKLDAIAATKA